MAAESLPPVTFTPAEVEAFARVAAIVQITGIVAGLEHEHGEDFGVPYATLLLKMARLEELLGEWDEAEDRDTIAAFTADLDQRQAALKEERRHRDDHEEGAP